jgi:hypothetical protein
MTLKFFNLDLHISVIEDVKNIFQKLYGDSVEITNWSISGHNWVFNKPTPNVEIIKQETWRNFNMNMVQLFQEKYDNTLKQYDGFIVTHTPVFAMLYEKYQKPILIVNSCRFDQPFCWSKNTEMLGLFHDCLHRLKQAKLLYMVSNNAADKSYLKQKIGLDSIHIPSLCLYTNAKYNPIKSQFIIYGRHEIFPSHKFLTKKPSGYSWKELYEYKGIIHTPYEMSTMSIFEHFWAGIPLFFPSREFYKQCILEGKMEFISMYDSWNTSILETDVDAWLDKADFYSFPYIYYYNSFDDLIQKIETFEDIHKNVRKQWIEKAIPLILDQWKELLTPIF